jgi:fucose 4-O-acetylase-like acetyltransferase
MQTLKRNTTISVAKGIAIILMVIGHSDCPGGLGAFIYEFHMPLFFITAGYFFSLKYLDDEMTFIKKRVKGLYVPFVKWATFFLLIHNLLFRIGIMNEQYGNGSGGVTHPYSWHQIEQSFWNIVTAMGGYDQFMCGAFWFFRGLLVASILYLILYKLWVSFFRKVGKRSFVFRRFGSEWLNGRIYTIAAIAVCVTILLLCAWKTSEGLWITTLVQGGYRDMTGVFFFGCGFLFRRYERLFDNRLWAIPVCFVVVLVFSIYFRAGMSWRGSYTQFLSLPIPALCGFWLTYLISQLIDRRETVLKRMLVFFGDNTLYVFIFHIISFKVVSVIKIVYYGLDWGQIGCHMVIHKYAQDDLFWIAYTIAGVGIPMIWIYYYRKLKSKMKRAAVSDIHS